MHLPYFGRLYQHLLFLFPFATEDFNYDDPGKWHINHPHCVGYRQSPIPIHTNKSIAVHLPPLIFGLYDEFFADCLELKNNGHTGSASSYIVETPQKRILPIRVVKFDIPYTVAQQKPFITGGFLNDIFESVEAHFHWGSWSQKGSEHTLNGRRYDLELHIVHRNKKYPNMKTATRYPDGVAVIALLFKVVRAPNVFYPELNEFYDSLEYLTEFNNTIRMRRPITLSSLMGNIDRENFYTYHGSLTTPPCSEVVTWHVFPSVIPISYRQLPKFWNLLDSRRLRLLNNVRPLQPVDNRKIFRRVERPRKQYYEF